MENGIAKMPDTFQVIHYFTAPVCTDILVLVVDINGEAIGMAEVVLDNSTQVLTDEGGMAYLLLDSNNLPLAVSVSAIGFYPGTKTISPGSIEVVITLEVCKLPFMK